MTFSIQLNERYKLILSDSNFKPMRKKPTISVYDAKKNLETKIASFNDQHTFESFIALLGLINGKTDDEKA